MTDPSKKKQLQPVYVREEVFVAVQELMAAHGMNQAAAMRILLERGLGRDNTDVREGVMAGQAILLKLIMIAERWLLRQGEAVNWDPAEVAKLGDTFESIVGSP